MLLFQATIDRVQNAKYAEKPLIGKTQGFSGGA